MLDKVKSPIVSPHKKSIYDPTQEG
ncbi:MAG: hypothetical protein RI902_2524, partial [Pseudomonadota bacterium]